MSIKVVFSVIKRFPILITYRNRDIAKGAQPLIPAKQCQKKAKDFESEKLERALARLKKRGQ